MMDLFILLATVLIKGMATVFFLALPWVAWQKGCSVRAIMLMAIGISVTVLLWWPFASGAEGVAQMLSQMWWLSVVVLVCAPLGMLAHSKRKKQIIN